jgi:hypothetical protein
MKPNPAHFRGCACPECTAARDHRSMIRIIIVAAVLTLICGIGIFSSGCSSAPAPAERTVAVQSLKAVGHAAEATVEMSAQLYRDGRITAEQARAIADFFDGKFQPAYRAAVATAQLDLTRPAPEQLLVLAQQLSALLAAYTPPKS